MSSDIMYAPGEFLMLLLQGEMMRRSCWPNDVCIRHDVRRQQILRLTGEDFSSHSWEPTHFDLLASDWEIL